MRSIPIALVTTAWLLHGLAAHAQSLIDAAANQIAPVSATQSLRVGKSKLSYTISWSALVLTNDSGAPAATISATSYVRTGLTHSASRPVLFAFNGGPGASSTPLHFTLLGPKRRIEKNSDIRKNPHPWVDNPQTLLDAVDLVLIDPVGTGYSRELLAGAGKSYWNVEGDGKATVQFIRNWLQHNGRTESPVFIAGESYGGARVAQISKDVADLNIAGLILISPALDFGATTGAGNDQPFIFDLPTMAVTAVAHGKVDSRGRSVEQIWNEARDFAQTEYAAALQQGSLLPAGQRAVLGRKIADLIGLTPERVEQSNLRVDSQVFLESLVPGQVVGRINTRIAAPKPETRADPSRPAAADDPALGMVGRSINKSEFAKAYLEDQAGLHTGLDYYALRLDLAMGWDWFGSAPLQAPGADIFSFRAYYNLTPNIATLMNERPQVRVFLMGGYYDLATPLLGPRYALTHSGVPMNRVTLLALESGHTPFEEEANRRLVSAALHRFIGPP